jgi:hypothetical protein
VPDVRHGDFLPCVSVAMIGPTSVFCLRAGN